MSFSVPLADGTRFRARDDVARRAQEQVSGDEEASNGPRTTSDHRRGTGSPAGGATNPADQGCGTTTAHPENHPAARVSSRAYASQIALVPESHRRLSVGHLITISDVQIIDIIHYHFTTIVLTPRMNCLLNLRSSSSCSSPT